MNLDLLSLDQLIVTRYTTVLEKVIHNISVISFENIDRTHLKWNSRKKSR